VLISGLVGVVVIVGVGSFITMAILTGVEVAYADPGSNIHTIDIKEQTRFVIIRESETVRQVLTKSE
jgi:hypothetical protein